MFLSREILTPETEMFPSVQEYLNLMLLVKKKKATRPSLHLPRGDSPILMTRSSLYGGVNSFSVKANAGIGWQKRPSLLGRTVRFSNIISQQTRTALTGTA